MWMFVRRRQGDEPFCRKCGFCLAGLTEPRVCPECGRGLDRKRAVVIGEARMKRRPVFVSLGLAIAGVLLIVVDGLGMRGVFPVVQYKPAWLLTAEAYLLGDRRASVATAEIHSRTTAGTLDASWQDRLVRISLDRHAQTWRVFPDAQWQVIIEAMDRNDLTFEQIERVWDDAIIGAELLEFDFYSEDIDLAFSVLDPPLVRRYSGERLWLTLGVNFRAGSYSPVRLGATGFPLNIKTTVRPVGGDGSDGEVLHIETWEREAIQSYVSNTLSPYGTRAADHMLQFRPYMPNEIGTHEVFVDLEFTCPPSLALGSGAGTLRRSIRLPLTLEVVELGSEDPVVVDPFSLADDPSTLISFRVSEDTATGAGGAPGVKWWIGTTQKLDPSIGLGGMLIFRQGDKVVRQRINYVGHHRSTAARAWLPGFEPGEVYVCYEQDAVRTRTHRHLMDRVLGGPIELGTIELPGKK